MCNIRLTQARICSVPQQMQGRRNSGRAAGAGKKLRAMETYKKQNNCLRNTVVSVQCNNADLRNNSQNYGKPVRIFWVRE